MNLNLALILFTIAALAFRASGAGNSPQTECVYAIPVSSSGNWGEKIYNKHLFLLMLRNTMVIDLFMSKMWGLLLEKLLK